MVQLDTSDKISNNAFPSSFKTKKSYKTNIKKKKKLPSMQINFNTNERKEKEADTIEMRFRESQNGRWMLRRGYQQAVANRTQYCKAK